MRPPLIGAGEDIPTNDPRSAAVRRAREVAQARNERVIRAKPVIDEVLAS